MVKKIYDYFKNSKTNKNKQVNKKNKLLWKPIRECYIRNKKNTFVSGSSIKNYMLKDPIIDWLDLYYKNKYTSNNIINPELEKKSMPFLCEMGYLFEKEVYLYLKSKYPNDIIDLTKDYFDKNNVNETLECIKNNIPIIYQATLYDQATNIGGTADLIIKGNWLNKLFNVEPNKMDLYYIIDIKWTSLHLCSDGIRIRNNNRMPAYKGQLAIYSYVLGKMQKEFPTKAYILAKSYKNNSFYYSYNCFNKLGTIDYDGFDKCYIKETSKAIKWIRDVRKNGHKWNLENDIRLLPNMNNKYDNEYYSIKKTIAKNVGELTSIWNVTKKNRDISISNGISSYYDKNCSSFNMGIYGKYSDIIDKIIKINKNNDSNDNIFPKKLKNTDIKKLLNDKIHFNFFVDFETLNTCFMNPQKIDIFNSKTDNILYMIGFGYTNNNSWVYHNFNVDDTSNNSELYIINQFVDLINEISANKIPRFYYWSNAEKWIFNNVNKKYNFKWTSWINKIEWVNLYDIFINEPIVIKNVTSYNLKDIVHGLYENNIIKRKWDDNLKSGIDSLYLAGKIYGGYFDEKKQEIELNKIVFYNEIDCEVLYLILEFLKSLV